jgi:DNA-binding NarL/FixJ family response regulator
MKPRVLLADDHTLVLAGFVKLLEDSCEVVGLVEDGRALLDAAQHLQPDIAIVDISMPLLNGIEACSRVRAVSPQTKLIVVTMHAAMPYVQAAFKSGAAGYVLKRSATDELLHAIRTVRSGNYYVTPLMTKDVVDVLVNGRSDSNASLDDLSTRQREILQLVAEGYTVKEIAGQLGLSPRTVEFHKGRAMQQLQVHSTAELVKYAIAHALIVPT